MAREIAEPTYIEDVVGKIKRWDERDTLFARTDLFRFFGEGSPQHKTHYGVHPEHLEYDELIFNVYALGKTAGIDYSMFQAQFNTIRKVASEAFVDGEAATRKAEIRPGRSAQKVKAIATHLGADLVSVGPLRQEWVYTHSCRSFGNREGFREWGTPVDLTHHTTAIALGFRMDYDLIRSAPDFPVLLATAQGYAIGAWVSIQLAEYLRMLGYSARAHHMYNYQVLAVPVAVDCGMGELSRAGFLLTRELGLGLRLAVVTTDMPIAHDKPLDIGVQLFCETCKICVENCPVDAIPGGDKTECNGVRKWKLDERKCYRYWQTAGTDCSLCMATCPWTKPSNWFHRLMARLAALKGPHQSWMTHADRLFYGHLTKKPRPDFIDSFERWAGPRADTDDSHAERS